ncbi:MAG: hypothetical protein HC831_31975 [Chloroflexia bacterium]|nr:hypothetical protein [Chloroflexia bacterium]
MDALAEADTVLHEALSRAEKAGNRKWIYQAHEELAKRYEQAGQHAEALRHYKAFHQNHKLALDDEIQVRIQSLKLSHEVESMRAELQREREQYEQDRAYSSG